MKKALRRVLSEADIIQIAGILFMIWFMIMFPLHAASIIYITTTEMRLLVLVMFGMFGGLAVVSTLMKSLAQGAMSFGDMLDGASSSLESTYHDPDNKKRRLKRLQTEVEREKKIKGALNSDGPEQEQEEKEQEQKPREKQKEEREEQERDFEFESKQDGDTLSEEDVIDAIDSIDGIDIDDLLDERDRDGG